MFLGAPFSGKGTQVDLLKDRINIPALQSGDLFRKESQSGSELGIKMAAYMNSGQLIPDDLTIDLITKTLSSAEYQNGVIMDGYPRNIDHLIIFENILGSINLEIDAIVVLDADYEMLLERVDKRLVCHNCSRPVTTADSELRNCCDNPNLIKRQDDSVEKFKTRYEVYKSNTIPLIEEVKTKYPEKIIYLDPMTLSTRSKEEISELIYNSISSLLNKHSRPLIDVNLN